MLDKSQKLLSISWLCRNKTIVNQVYLKVHHITGNENERLLCNSLLQMHVQRKLVFWVVFFVELINFFPFRVSWCIIFWENFLFIVFKVCRRYHIMLHNNHNSTYKELQATSGRTTITGRNKKLCRRWKAADS